MALLTMSKKELSRLEIIHKVRDRELKQTEAATALGLTVRQVQRLVKSYLEQGAPGLVSQRRGKPSNRCYPSGVKENALNLIRQYYPDFGPTLATEKLLERHELSFSVETIRQWMVEEGIWITRQSKAARVHQPRYRRDCIGELIQIDGSIHKWFEDRGPECTLLVYIDDATSKLMELRFCQVESTFDYFISTRRYLERHGKPVAFYSDKHSTFRVNQVGAIGGTGMTQFGRALNELNMEIICANSSQAKGRVERANKTLQDRFIKELRLIGISDMVSANNYAPDFIKIYNGKFAKEPRNDKDVHRPVTENNIELDDIFAWQVERTVSKNLTIQYDKVLYLLEPNELTKKLVKKKVIVFDYPDGSLAIKYNGQALPYSVFDKVRQVKQADVVSNKRLGAVLEYAKQEQQKRPVCRSKKAPSRKAQQEHRQINPAVLDGSAK